MSSCDFHQTLLNQQVVLKHSCVKEHWFVSDKMADKNFFDITLAYADRDLLLCWEEKVKQGAECTLLLKHSKGKIETILKSRSAQIIQPKVLPSADKPYIPAKKKKRKKAGKKKRLEALPAFQKRLVEEKGLPLSQLMLQLLFHYLT